MTIQIGMLLFPRMTQLDLTGPLEVLHRVPGAEVNLVWKDLDPVHTTSGMRILPTATMRHGPRLDVLVVPGGYGTADLLDDTEVLDWIATQSKTVRYLTSVCTGALVLGAAGLLQGYDAATHWAYMSCSPSSARAPCAAAWSSTATASPPAGSRPGSTSRCGSLPSWRATT